MKSVALPAAIMAGVTSYAAAYHTLLHIRTGRRVRRDGQFGLLAFGIALYAMFSSLLYLSESVAEGAYWERLQQVSLSCSATVLIHFVDSYAEVKGPAFLRRMSWMYTGLALVALVERRGWLLTGVPDIKRIQAPWFGEVIYYEEAVGPLFFVLCTAVPLMIVYSTIVAIRARHAGSPRRARVLLIGVAVFLVGVIHDGLVAADYFQSIYMIEYAFTSILLLVSYSLSAEVVAAARHMQESAERERAMADARRLESLGRLAGAVAHDLNNMLTPVVSYLELALRRIDPQLPEHSYVSSASDAAGRAAVLAQRLLALGRKQVLDVRTIDLGAGLKALAPLMQHLFSAPVQLEVDVTGRPPLIDADAGQIDQVWMNLAANARDAMPAGGKFSFQVETRSDGVCVTVRDTGVGMSNETALHIFEPFFTTKPRGKGTGLGLSIVRGIVEQHGGRIELQTAVGQGATFRLWFPHAAQSAVRESVPTPNLDSGDDGRRVLVVDDDESIRMLVVTLLSDAGFQVCAAGSERELRAQVDQLDALDLLLSDVILPDTDGPKVKEIVSERFPSAACLFMTGHADGLLAPRGVLRREVDLLRKPFSGDQLVAKVEDVLQRKARAERRAAASLRPEGVEPAP